MDKLEKFLQIIGYQFKNSSLLEEALTHPSLSKTSHTANYQRLEFLGDAVLGMVIAEILIKKYPAENEGALSRRQAHLVSGDVLSQVAQNIGISEVLKLSEGENIIGGKTNKKNLENACEALIGAIYLDSGLESCQEFILKNWQKIIDENQTPPQDPVSLLQEIVQSKSKKSPIYDIKQTGGNSHQPVFTATLEIDQKQYSALGSSKKEAQKNAAILALDDLNS
ncbi:MAG: rnc [Rickettsiaceae bacterium]|jgi:ribonuclease-3|nr:rnc [Rickettsiaceae bacterium]